VWHSFPPLSPSSLLYSICGTPVETASHLLAAQTSGALALLSHGGALRYAPEVLSFYMWSVPQALTHFPPCATPAAVSSYQKLSTSLPQTVRLLSQRVTGLAGRVTFASCLQSLTPLFYGLPPTVRFRFFTPTPLLGFTSHTPRLSRFNPRCSDANSAPLPTGQPAFPNNISQIVP